MLYIFTLKKLLLNLTMVKSILKSFFFADIWRFAIILLIIIAIILLSFVFGKTFSRPQKFKLIFIVMLNLMITAILNSVGFILNWVDEKNNKLLFGKEDGFFCKAQSFMLFYFHASRETFVTLISIISFISFKFGYKFNIDKSKLSFILVFLVGYLNPLIANIIYVNIDVYGQGDYYCFTRGKYSKGTNEEKKNSRICGMVHTCYVMLLMIISISFISYLVIKTTNCKKGSSDNSSWINDDDEKYCIHPMLKKIIFFPIVQIFLNVVLLFYRIKDLIIDFNGVDYLARPAAALSSVSTISYTLIFAITNKIFTEFEEETKIKRDYEDGIEISDSPGIGLFELERE